MSRDVVIVGGSGANLASLQFALGRLGVEATVTEDPERAARATHVILPGVGSAGSAMRRLRETGVADAVPRLTQPVIGICLGMQLLFETSEEEQVRCLGVIPGRVERFPDRPDLPVPQMGWNEVKVTGPTRLLAGVDDGGYAYFVHSYAVPVGPYTRAVAEYGAPFSAVVEHGNFYGAQFHPERSSQFGARILQNFLDL